MDDIDNDSSVATEAPPGGGAPMPPGGSPLAGLGEPVSPQGGPPAVDQLAQLRALAAQAERQAAAAQAPQKPGSTLQAIVHAALVGLGGGMAAMGTHSGSQGLQAGLQFGMQQAQNEQQQQAAQKKEEQDRIKNQFEMIKNAALLHDTFRKIALQTPGSPEAMQAFITNQMNTTNDAVKAGARIVSTADSQKDAEKWAADNHWSNGNFEVQVRPYRDPNTGQAKFAVIQFPDAMNNAPVTVTTGIDENGNRTTREAPTGSINMRDWHKNDTDMDNKLATNSLDVFKQKKIEQFQAEKQKQIDQFKETLPSTRAETGLKQAQTGEAKAKTVEAYAQAGKIKGEDADLELVARELVKPNNLTALKNITSLRGDQRMHVYAAAKKLDPNFDPGVVDQRIKFFGEFTDPNGKTMQGINSLNTFMQHAGDLVDTVGQYRTTSLPVINTPLNKIRDKFGDSSYTDFVGAIQPVRTEYVNALNAGYAPHDSDKRDGDTLLSDAATPAQIEAAAKRMGHSIVRRADSYNQEFRTYMGTDYPNLITPEAKGAATKLGLGGAVAKYGSGGQVGQKAITHIYDPTKGIAVPVGKQ